jgi:hypothetical protein
MSAGRLDKLRAAMAEKVIDAFIASGGKPTLSHRLRRHRRLGHRLGG